METSLAMSACGIGLLWGVATVLSAGKLSASDSESAGRASTLVSQSFEVGFEALLASDEGALTNPVDMTGGDRSKPLIE